VAIEMNFDDQLKADINAVFLNIDEFAATHIIDGQPVMCVLDADRDGLRVTDATDGTYIASKCVYVRAGDLAKIPVPGKRIDIDGRPFMCLSVTNESGMLEIKITEYSPT
jgi:hypothetical protein